MRGRGSGKGTEQQKLSESNDSSSKGLHIAEALEARVHRSNRRSSSNRRRERRRRAGCWCVLVRNFLFSGWFCFPLYKATRLSSRLPGSTVNNAHKGGKQEGGRTREGSKRATESDRDRGRARPQLQSPPPLLSHLSRLLLSFPCSLLGVLLLFICTKLWLEITSAWGACLGLQAP